jgi:hypothetical protein
MAASPRRLMACWRLAIVSGLASIDFMSQGIESCCWRHPLARVSSRWGGGGW